MQDPEETSMRRDHAPRAERAAAPARIPGTVELLFLLAAGSLLHGTRSRADSPTVTAAKREAPLQEPVAMIRQMTRFWWACSWTALLAPGSRRWLPSKWRVTRLLNRSL